MGLVQREIEAAGISTISLSMMPELTQSVGVPRIAAIEHPFGLTLGLPGGRCTPTRGVEGNITDTGGDLPTGYRRPSSLRMGLQGEAQHTSARSSADRAVSQAAPMASSEILEPDAPRGFQNRLNPERFSFAQPPSLRSLGLIPRD